MHRFEKGHIPWNKGLLISKGKLMCPVCSKSFYYSTSRHIYCSIPCRAIAFRLRNKKRLLLKERKRNRELRKLVIEKLGSKCVNCGERDYRVLQLNHINGGGRKDKALRTICREILDGKRDGDFDLRCANCNILYEYERNQ